MDPGYWNLCDLAAPGWSLREGYACGPAAEGPLWLKAPRYDVVVWRTWCHLFGHFRLQDDEVYVWPDMPEDWRGRISEARRIWDAANEAGRLALSKDRSAQKEGP